MNATASTVHDTFVLERTYPVPPDRVFFALGPRPKTALVRRAPGWTSGPHEMDFSVGGQETSEVTGADGVVHRFEARYCDIVDDARVVFCYAMYLGERRISVSLTTMELEPVADGTRLTFTEQGAFLDGADDVKARIVGTEGLLDSLGRALTD